MCNKIIVNLFTKEVFFFLLISIADMAVKMSNFDNFDIDQINVFKICSEIVLCR